VVHHATVARLEGLVASPEALRRALRREDMRSAAASRIHCSARGCSRDARGGGRRARRGAGGCARVACPRPGSCFLEFQLQIFKNTFKKVIENITMIQHKMSYKMQENIQMKYWKKIIIIQKKLLKKMYVNFNLFYWLYFILFNN
jgi:hypothetical protein